MTPTQINKAIRAGQIFYVKDLLAKPPKNELIVERAKTITNKSGLRRVKVETMIGWLFATEVRRAGSFEPITLDGEGPMTRWMN